MKRIMLVNEFLFGINKQKKISGNIEFKFEHLPVFKNYFKLFFFLNHFSNL